MTIIHSTKHVNLIDGSYRCFWSEYVVTVPVKENDRDVDLDFPVSHQNPSLVAKPITIHVKDGFFQFEAK